MSELWWYSRGRERIGPVTRDAIRELVLGGEIDRKTLVWREGMEQWTRMADVSELQGIHPALPPELPMPSRDEEVRAMPDAGAGRRFFARLIDFYSLAVPIAVAIGFFGSRASPEFAAWLQRPGNDLMLGILILPLALFAEALVYGIFGTTLGKGILGVKITNFKGEPPDIFEYIGRQIGVWSEGFGLGIPIVNLFTMARQRSRVSKGNPTSYDSGEGFTVKASRLGVLRVLSALIVVTVLLFVFGGLVALAQEFARRNHFDAVSETTPSIIQDSLPSPAPAAIPVVPAASFAAPPGSAAATSTRTLAENTVPWTNPVTGKTALIPRGFTEVSMERATTFEGPKGKDVVVLITSAVRGESQDLKEAAQEWQATIPNETTPLPSGTQTTAPDGRPVWIFTGRNKTTGFAIFYAKSTDRIWQIMVAGGEGSDDASIDLALTLKDCLLSTL